jgi:syntaxin 6
MYTQIDDNTGHSSDIQSTVSQTSGEDVERRAVGTRKIVNKSSDLRQSLMDDDESAVADELSVSQSVQDVESGRFQGTHPRGLKDDPFYAIKQDLLIKFDLADGALERLEHIIRTTDTAVNTHEVKENKKQLKRQIKNAESTLKDLQTTVKVVEKKRDRFPEIDDSELSDRKQFIQSSISRITAIKARMNSQELKTKMIADERAKTKRRIGVEQIGSKDNEDTEFLGGQHATAQLMMQEQDETLDDLDNAVIRVGHMASNIHEELGHQNKMLKNLEDDLQDAEEHLGMVMGKLGKFLKTNNKFQLRTIITLCLIVVILFFLVLYT